MSRPYTVNPRTNIGADSAMVEKKKELPLSTKALKELIWGVFSKGASFRFRAKGFSMSPFIRDGDIITLLPLNGKLPRLGDMVAFMDSSSKRLAVHRVVRKRRDSHFVLKGDNLLDTDGWVPVSNTLGYVGRVERGGKRVSLGLGPERVFIAFLNRKELLMPFMALISRLLRLARIFTRRAIQ